MPVLKTKLKFAVSVTEGNMPLMKQVIQDGVSASVGLKCGSVSVISLQESKLGATRQLQHCAESKVSLEIKSAGKGVDSPELTKLGQDLRKACTEGSLVTFVKAAAAEKGALTQCLKDQTNELPEPTIERAVVQRDVVIQQRPTYAPTKQPTESGETYSPSTSPTPSPTVPTKAPTKVPTKAPTLTPTPAPTAPKVVVAMLLQLKSQSTKLEADWSTLTNSTVDSKLGALNLPGVEMQGTALISLHAKDKELIGKQ
jgi:hypothetical protein